jgi:hypothetical protein
MKRIIIILMFAMICSQSAHAANESIPCGAEPTNMAIDYGDVIGCTIDPIGDTDIYHINGTTDELVTILVTRAGNDFVHPCIELTAPDNTTTVECNPTDNRIDTVLDQTGTFSLLVSDWNNDGIGDYTISLQCISGDCLDGSGDGGNDGSGDDGNDGSGDNNNSASSPSASGGGCFITTLLRLLL